MSKGDSNEVSCPFPRVSRGWRECEVVATRSERQMATVALMKTADRLPAFFSSRGDLTESMSCAMIFLVDARSCKGRRRENSSMAASTTAVAGGGGSLSW